jgi:Holliday junction resolvase RusA-like endonuclease
MTSIRIEVDGVPQPGGSKRVVTLPPLIRRLGRPMGGEMWLPAKQIMKVVRVLDDNPKATKWKQMVERAAIRQLGVHPIKAQRILLDEELIVATVFYMPRPKHHYKKGGDLTAEGQRHDKPLTKPDALKLMRSTEDALTGVVWSDDAVITDHFIHKRYAERRDDAGCIIHVFPAAQYQYEIKFRGTT